jgi:uroporphyrinogen-III synthase
MVTLKGARVALLEARMTGELSELVKRFDGVPHSVPALREVPRLDQIPAFIDALRDGRFSVAIFLTGVGASTVLREAERLGRLAEAVGALRAATVVCRGPKPVAALNRYAVATTVKAVEPYTTTELLEALTSIDLRDTGVALVHYGEPNQGLADALAARGARLEEICPYEWHMPEDAGPLAALVRDLIDGRVDAIAFTSQIQWRHLFRVATDLGCGDRLIDAMNRHTIVAAIGPVCADALRAVGVTPHVLPAHPKMGALIGALAEWISSHGRPNATSTLPRTPLPSSV